MRSVNKGANATVFAKYRDAVGPLIDRLGAYCSYCEMVIDNEPDVEHVHPKSKGGALTSWSNFLLGCKKCNKIKSAKNPDRNNHLWPDEDNTSVAYEYYGEVFVRADTNLAAPTQVLANNTLTLTGIDRIPKKINKPDKQSQRDGRWRARRVAWGRADRCLANWLKNPTLELAEVIGENACASGFYSIWVMKFAAHPQVLAEIKGQYRNTYEPVPDAAGGFTMRPGGRF